MIEDADARQHRMGEIAEELDPGEREQRDVGAQQLQRADRVGASPRERTRWFRAAAISATPNSP